jgi:hypothetical protein
MDKVVHFEIPADDLARAKEFYKDIFGWKIEDVPDMDYTMLYTTEVDDKMMVKEPGAINGGMWKRDKGDDKPVLVIAVASVDEYVKKIEEKGGKILVPKMKVGDMGLYAKFSDPEGNVLGIWENLKEMS